jgi:septal ring factor EnvC (AmiA/AmiB activator)
MMNDDQIKQQIQAFLMDKNMSDNERIAFLLAATDILRKKMALEVEQSLDENDVKEIEAITDDQQAMAEMVKRWEAKTGKTSEVRAQEILNDFLEKFLTEKDKPAENVSAPVQTPAVEPATPVETPAVESVAATEPVAPVVPEQPTTPVA